VNRWDRVVYAVRSDSVPSMVTAAALVGFWAGLLDASGTTEPLLVYLAGWAVATVGVLVIRRRSIRLWALRGLIRLWHALVRSSPGTAPAASQRSQSGDGPTEIPAALRTVPAHIADVVRLTSTPDPYYFGSFRSLVDGGGNSSSGERSPLIVTPCNPRDVGRPENLLHPVVVDQWDGRPVRISLGPWAGDVQLIRQLPRGDDTDHAFASRDICYLPELGAELLRLGPGHRPLCLPEHCVDVDLLAHHDLVVLSGPDTNFWHAALFEAVAQRFERPPSTVPLAVGLRDTTTRGTPVYGSSDLFVHLRGAADAVGLPRSTDALRLPETARPTYGMIVATANPLADPDAGRWCVFLAGTRSLGTMAATLSFTALLRALRRHPEADLFSLVPAGDLPGHVPVTAALVRASMVEAAAGPHEDRDVRSVPHDRPDPQYRDSYVVTEAEVLDTRDEEPSWFPLTLDDPSDPATGADGDAERQDPTSALDGGWSVSAS
jgi:hypothetical protein